MLTYSMDQLLILFSLINRCAGLFRNILHPKALGSLTCNHKNRNQGALPVEITAHYLSITS